MKTIFEAKVTAIGEDVPMILEEKVIILFDEKAPKELHDVALTHSGGSLTDEIQAGDVVWFGVDSFDIYFVGDHVNTSMKDLGHLSFSFSGDQTSDLPGTVCIEDKPIPQIPVGTTIKIVRY